MQLKHYTSPLLAARARGPTPFRPPQNATDATRKSGTARSAIIGRASLSSLPRGDSATHHRNRVAIGASAAATAAASAASKTTTPSQQPSSVSSSSSAPTFQDAITKLQAYWANVGCALWLPHNTEVREGTTLGLGCRCPCGCRLCGAPCMQPCAPCMRAWRS